MIVYIEDDERVYKYTGKYVADDNSIELKTFEYGPRYEQETLNGKPVFRIPLLGKATIRFVE